uniref:Uncharacterized protein n=1 Tax=Anguilla anguilla TaxID=7936 RepID=A0A0E9Y0K7_ANGAN
MGATSMPSEESLRSQE